MKLLVLAVVTLLLLTGCATARKPPQIIQSCPTLPALPPLEAGALEHDFIETMQQLLQGKLPWQPDYSLSSDSADSSMRLHAW